MKKYLSTLSILLVVIIALGGCGLNFEPEKEPRTTLDRTQWPTPVRPTDTPKPTPFPKSTTGPTVSAAESPTAPAQNTAPAQLDLQQLLNGENADQLAGLDWQKIISQLPPDVLSQLDLNQLASGNVDITDLLAQLDLSQLSADDLSKLLASLNLDQASQADVSQLLSNLQQEQSQNQEQEQVQNQEQPTTSAGSDVLAELGGDQITGGTTTNLLNQAGALGGLSPVAVLKTSADQTSIRQGPGPNYGVTEVVEKGELGAVLGTDSSRNWLYIITIKNVRGWIAQSDARIVGTLDEAPVLPPNPLSLITQQVAGATGSGSGAAVESANVVDLNKLNPVATARVSSDLLNLRQRPGPGYKQLDALPIDSEVAVLGLNRDRQWALVATAQGKTGWVSLDFLDVTGSLQAAPIYRTLEPQAVDSPAPLVEVGQAAAAATSHQTPPAAVPANPPASPIPGDKSFAPVATANVQEKVDMRTGPGQQYGALAESTVDQKVTVLAVNPGRTWAFIRNPLSKYGWVPLSTINVVDGTLDNAKPVVTGLITSDNLTLSSGPGIYYSPVGPVARNEFVSVLGLNAGRNWARVETVGGGTGWIQLRLIEISGSITALPQAQEPPVAQATPAQLTPPAPSGPPSGTLVFQTSSGGDIMKINADGSGLSLVTQGGIDPVLSPDGRQIAFTRWQGDVGTLWVANLDGSGERAVLGEMRKAKGPAWSPDGQQIVLNFQQGGQPNDEHVCRAAGSQIPFGRAANIHFSTGENGKPLICFTLLADPHWSLRVVDVNDGRFQDKYGGQYAFRPAWDPVQTWRIVSAAGNGLLATDANNPDYRNQLTDVIGDGSPVFSPDGRFIAVTTDTNGTYDIYRLNADGSGRVQLTKTPLWETVQPTQDPKPWNNVAPAWSPDGSRIAFLTDRTGRWEIWVMNADGSNPQPLFSDEVNQQLDITYNFVDERVLSWR